MTAASTTEPEAVAKRRVILADDDVLLREGVASLLERSGFDVIGQVAGGETVGDAELCTAIRDLYSSVLTLSPQEALLFARYDVSP